MLQPMPTPQMIPTRSVVSELERLYFQRSAIDRLIDALEEYRKTTAKGEKPQPGQYSRLGDTGIGA